MLVDTPERLDLRLAAGGRMRQAIHDDPYGIDAWDQEHGRRCFVTILGSESWTAITGEAMPTKPIDAAAYTAAGLPWFRLSNAPANDRGFGSAKVTQKHREGLNEPDTHERLPASDWRSQSKGERTAQMFVAEGARVVAAGRRETEGRALEAKCGPVMSFIRTDVTDETSVKAMVDHAVTGSGG
jgi:hypothetical protein